MQRRTGHGITTNSSSSETAQKNNQNGSSSSTTSPSTTVILTSNINSSAAATDALSIPKGGDNTISSTSTSDFMTRRKKGTAIRRRRRSNAAFQAHFGATTDRSPAEPIALLTICCAGLILGICFVLVGIRVLSTETTTTTTTTADNNNKKKPVAFSSIYQPPESLLNVGDKSDDYAALRLAYDEEHPDDLVRTRSVVQSLRKHTFEVYENPQYDIYNCPDDPPPGYPHQWKLLDEILHDWPTNDIATANKRTIYQGFCVFDYMLDKQKAERYRKAEVPFVVQNDPSVQKTVERWNTPNYVDTLLGDTPHRTEYSPNNHFMYWIKPGTKMRNKKLKTHFTQIEKPQGWTQPTQMMRMPYAEWLGHAQTTEVGPDQPHWYYRLIGCGEMEHGDCDKGSSEYLFDELPFFQPRETLYVVEPERQKGIHCRFGMKGVIAENHFDGSRNSIALLGGERRYILAHPNQCENLSLYPKGHPSARHSAVDWSDPDVEEFPQFRNAMANEVVMQAGDVMYLPTNWFHYIVSLEINYQCNTRSGISNEYMQDIHDCGF